MALTRMWLNGEEPRKPSISHPGTCTKMEPQIMKTGGCKQLMKRHSKVTKFDGFSMW